MINKIYDFWGIKPEHVFGDEFTGYEDLYSEFDKFTKEVYNEDPENTIDSVFNLYRLRNLVPIIYYTEQGIDKSIRSFRAGRYNHVQSGRLASQNAICFLLRKKSGRPEYVE